MSFFEKIEAIWKNVSIVQRALLIAICLAVVIAGVSLSYWARRPDMRVLYSGLDPEEAAKITDKISDKGIVYKLASGGTTIYAPAQHISQLRLEMAKNGLPESGQKGYGIFDDEKIGISPFVQNINLKRALQDELAKSIQMIDGVGHARIHIVSSDRTLFSSNSSNTSASVVLRMKPGFRLSGSNIAAITHLVAGSVEGLDSQKVTIVDSSGNLLSSESDDISARGAGTVADYRERIEQNYAKKVEDMLLAVLGPGRSTVKVSAIIDMNSINIVKESYAPKGVPLREEIKSGSEAGAASASKSGETLKGSLKKDETILTEFQYDKTVKQEVILPGQIKSLAVAAFVDLYPEDPNSKDLIMAKSDVEDIIKNALGLKDTSSIKVVNARFPRPMASLINQEEAGGLDLVAIAGQASVGIMSICALLVLKMFSGAKKKAATGQLPPGANPAALLEAGGETGQLAMSNQIASALQSNPDQVKQLFANWIEEKE